MERYVDQQTCLGAARWKKAVDSRILMIGAGGIGCELLKNLVMMGFQTIEVIDLDTIDVSNLNRQFLFQKQHVKKSKAHVAKETALKFNPNVNIVSYHNSIYEPQYDVEWFSRFDIVLNALDNLPARRHVNMMCLAANVPLVESGTAGYQGQVTVHHKKTHCFECEPKPTPKTFPVCTIRSTPSAPIHCIVWAKSYLFAQLFGKDDEEDSSVQTTADDNAEELATLKKEAEALRQLKASAGQPDYAKNVFKKTFKTDIERLLTMEDMWKSRQPPVPLDYESLIAQKEAGQQIFQGIERDHTVWSLYTNFNMFLESLEKLGNRYQEGIKTEGSDFMMSFDKDDDEALDFVTSVANLRATIYGIDTLSRFKIKEMAGNIIPAIATTNAIIAGLIVIEAIKILNHEEGDCFNTYLTYGGANPQLVCSETIPSTPLLTCSVCQAGYFILCVNTGVFTLERLVGIMKAEKLEVSGVDGERVGLKGLGLSGDVTVSEGGRLIYDEDFDDNLSHALKSLKIGHGSRVIVMTDDDEEPEKNVTVNLFIVHREGMNDTEFILKGEREIPTRPKPPQPEDTSLKRKHEEDDKNGGDLEIVDDEIQIL